MRFLRSKHGMVTCVVVAAALLFLVRPGANRLKTRVVSSLSLALGRTVDVSSVRLRLLPHPGFDLDNFVVHDDSAFGTEPMLRAQEVIASLRLTSLIRGKLEISRLEFVEPSLNLVRAQGQWNLTNLVERTEKIAIAPTAKAKGDKRPSFPYIEGQRGRINFKVGQEKKPYALVEADFALWQESEDQWSIRLKARPVSSDFNLTDTGVIQVRGAWARARSLRETPVQFTFDWDAAQLGQLSKLAYGSDKGWRGAVRLSMTVVGSAANLALTASASANDLRRYNVITADSMRLQTQCSARYSFGEGSLSDIACHIPMGDAGLIELGGDIERPLGIPAYNLLLKAKTVPVQSLVLLARHCGIGLPAEMLTSGQVSAEFHGQLMSNQKTASWGGTGQASALQLKSGNDDSAIEVGTIPFAMLTKHAPLSAGSTKRKEVFVTGPQVQIGPFHAALGKATPMTITGQLWAQGYEFGFHGDAQLKELLEAARLVGIHAPQPNAEGSAKLDLDLAGEWSGQGSRPIIGKAQLQAVRAQPHGFNAPVEIHSADLMLAQDNVKVKNLVAFAAGTSWRGSLMFDKPCATHPTCAVHFKLHADEITIARLNQLLNPHAKTESWYQALSPVNSGTPYLLMANATGTLNADRIIIENLTAENLSANVELKNGKLRLLSAQADVLGGKHIGEWNADFTVKPPQYSGSGTFQGIALAQLANATNGDWITGTATASYTASASGLKSSELLTSAIANLRVDAVSGSLPHLTLTSASAPLQMHRVAANLFLHDGKLEFRTGGMDTNADFFHLSGTASLTQVLNLKLTRDDTSGFNITGTLADPHVSPVIASEARAALKP